MTTFENMAEERPFIVIYVNCFIKKCLILILRNLAIDTISLYIPAQMCLHADMNRRCFYWSHYNFSPCMLLIISNKVLHYVKINNSFERLLKSYDFKNDLVQLSRIVGFLVLDPRCSPVLIL